jgi:hypothetical protein
MFDGFLHFATIQSKPSKTNLKGGSKNVAWGAIGINYKLRL